MARFVLPLQAVYDGNGKPIAGAKLFFYEEFTAIPKDTYSDQALSVPNANPVIADSGGVFGDIYLDGEYRAELTDANDVTQPGYPADGVATSTAGSVLSKDVAGGIDVTLTAGEAGNTNYKFSGVLTANINVIVPDVVHNFTVENNTTGAFTLTMKTSAGTGITVVQGEAAILYCDATNVIDPNSGKAALSEAQTFSGVQTFSDRIDMDDALNTSKATVASHATTSDIWSAAGNLIAFTGTEIITDLPEAPQEGVQRRLTCDDAVTFTDNANLDVAGGTQTLSAGDIAVVDAVTTTTFKVTILHATGERYLVPLAVNDHAGEATSDFTGLDGTYDHYIFMLKEIIPSDDAATLLLTVGTGVTPTWQVADYQYHTMIPSSSASAYNASFSSTAIGIILASLVGSLPTEGLSGDVTITDVSTTGSTKKIKGDLVSVKSDGNVSHGKAAGRWIGSNDAITGIRFAFTTGNIASGRIAMYGVKNV